MLGARFRGLVVDHVCEFDLLTTDLLNKTRGYKQE